MLHPDRHGGSAEAHEKFLELKAAYELLSDEAARAEYDRNPNGVSREAAVSRRRREQLARRKARLRKLFE